MESSLETSKQKAGFESNSIKNKVLKKKFQNSLNYQNNFRQNYTTTEASSKLRVIT